MKKLLSLLATIVAATSLFAAPPVKAARIQTQQAEIFGNAGDTLNLTFDKVRNKQVTWAELEVAVQYLWEYVSIIGPTPSGTVTVNYETTTSVLGATNVVASSANISYNGGQVPFAFAQNSVIVVPVNGDSLEGTGPLNIFVYTGQTTSYDVSYVINQNPRVYLQGTLRYTTGR